MTYSHQKQELGMDVWRNHLQQTTEYQTSETDLYVQPHTAAGFNLHEFNCLALFYLYS